MNNIAIMGRLTKDPELKTTQNGNEIARFTVAVDFYNGKEKVADFFPCVAFGKTAAKVCRYLTKGSDVGVVGEIHSEKYKDRNGNDRQAWSVTASKVTFATAKKPQTETTGIPSDGIPTEVVVDDDDFPF